MQCDYYDADLCRSCTLMGQPYALQLRDLERHVRETLGGLVAESAWQQTAFGPESHFRNKAKLVVGGVGEGMATSAAMPSTVPPGKPVRRRALA